MLERELRLNGTLDAEKITAWTEAQELLECQEGCHICGACWRSCAVASGAVHELNSVKYDGYSERNDMSTLSL